MGISELRQLDVEDSVRDATVSLTGRALVQAGKITRADAARAQLVGQQCDAPIDRILTAEGLAREEDLLAVHACRLSSRALTEADVAKARPWHFGGDPGKMLKHEFLPIEVAPGRPALVTSKPDALSAIRAELPLPLADAQVVLAPRAALQAKIAEIYREDLTLAAQTRVPEEESCRTWDQKLTGRVTLTLAGLAGLLALTLLYPTLVFGVFAAWAVFTLLISAVLKSAAFIANAHGDGDRTPLKEKAPLPKVSILVPLFQETEIAHALVARLSRLTYPKCLLDVVLILEEEDTATRETLATIDLPPWIRAVVVPDGQPRTKPRAMNYALDFCEGDIVGIFDAEDAPEPDQIMTVARRFLSAPEDVVCLQGVLDYYNPLQNWLARCFTIEYATWFRVILPGMQKLGFAIPLGGTTLYFKREVLEELGGWDAHNVTEDADLGFRLARHGYRTEMIGTVTEEEANCRPWPWVKQRSRWLKGYMTTYLVHMRRPKRLYRQLGAWKFWGFQAHFVSALSQFVLAPFLWSFWLVLLGLPHPLDPVLPRAAMVMVGSFFLVVEVLNVVIYMTAVSGRRHKPLMPWAPTMHFYTPLGAVAAYKALYELILKPYFWDKTAHGMSVQASGRRQSDGAVDLTGIKLKPCHKRL